MEDTSSDDDEERDEREMLQCLKHLIRLEVEKKAFELIESEPGLARLGEEVQQLKEVSKQDCYQESAEDPGEEEEGIGHSQHIDVFVSMTH